MQEPGARMSDKKKRILFVDDEPSILKTVGKQLEVAGFEVITAGEGDGALVAAQSEMLDVIILDLMMPNKSGMEVCQILRADARYAKIPIIFYSGKGQEMTPEVLKEWGADAYLSKTRGTDVLISTIEALLQKYS